MERITLCITLIVFSCFTYRLPWSPLRAVGIFDCGTLGMSFAIGWPRRKRQNVSIVTPQSSNFRRLELNSVFYSANCCVFTCLLWSSQTNETPFRSSEFRLYCFLNTLAVDTGKIGLSFVGNGGRERTHLSHSPVAQVKHLCMLKSG